MVRALLPADAGQGPAYPGVNNEASHKPDGTCSTNTFSSASLAAVVKGTNPSWTEDPAKAALVFYSGHDTSEDGSDSPYQPGQINEVAVGIGGENRGADGVVHC